MAKELELEVANFVCRFGENKVLSDELDQVVIPAFFANEVRDIKGTEYFFENQEMDYLKQSDIDSLALSCRFIKKTILKRYQIHSESKGIVKDEKSLDSAPSAVAILLLHSHRLLYVKEVPGAPSIQQFGSTFRYFMRNIVMAHRDAVYQTQREAGNKVTRKQVANDIPIPDVDIVPIPASESLKNFLARFKTLSSLKMELAPTNNEVDNEEFFKQLRGTKNEVGSATTRLTHSNPNGLDKDGVYDHVEAAKQGNVYVTMSGEDKNGDDLKGDNDDFSVRAVIGPAGMEYPTILTRAFSQFASLVSKKIVALSKPKDDLKKKLQAALKQHQEGNVDE